MKNAQIKEKLQALYDLRREEFAAQAQEGLARGELLQPVFGLGNPSPSLVLVGEAPGAEETKLSQPFMGKAGKQLDELLALAGLERENIYITNVVKYRPVVRSQKSVRNRTPDRREIEAGLPLLLQELLLLRPPVVATLGNVPLGALLTLCSEKKEVIGSLHGTAKAVAVEDWKFLLYPMYHPASTIYRRELLPICEQDAKRLGEIVTNL